MKFYVAQEAFSADLESGAAVAVGKGEVLPDSHELVKRDAAGAGLLFKPMAGQEEEPEPEPEAPAPKPRARQAKGSG